MKFRKKPVVIEAIQWNGTEASFADIGEFMGGHYPYLDKDKLLIITLEGTHFASIGDWIIKGIKGEFYPCKPDIFEQTYERA